MNADDRAAIDGLFSRLAEAETRAPARDAGADAFIQARLSEQPGAPYYMAQTIVVQEHALADAQSRIEALEAELAQRQESDSGGLFGGLFGGGAPASRPPRRASTRTGPAGAPFGMPHQGAGQAQGGFLAGAAQTAIGVAGGVLVANAIADMMAGDEAQAADVGADPASGDPGADESSGGFFDAFGEDDF